MAFKIEKIKWEWAKPVVNKEVYRDDEFVKTRSKTQALKAIDFLMSKHKGLTYTITVLRDKQYYTYFRHSMPCLGGLVKYKASHGDDHFMNPYFPRDIRVAFPEGKVVFIACYGKIDQSSEYTKFILSEESPWVSAFGTKDTIIFKENYFVLTNMDTDPTVFYSIYRLGSLTYGITLYHKWNPKANILASKYTAADPRRLAGQKPLKISGGTWAEGFGYTRPYNESIFKTKLPTKYKDFGKLGSYPNAPYSGDYFLKVMKEVFGIKITQIKATDTKLEAALVEAWDYFKEESKKLKDTA